jgi:hypothetical protein
LKSISWVSPVYLFISDLCKNLRAGINISKINSSTSLSVFPFDSSCFPPDGCETDIVANNPSPLMVIKKPL